MASLTARIVAVLQDHAEKYKDASWSAESAEPAVVLRMHDVPSRVPLYASIELPNQRAAIVNELGTSDAIEIVVVDKFQQPGTSERLTPRYLGGVVLPYLEAIGTIQRVIDEVRHRQPRDIEIFAIRRSSPITINLSGVTDAIETVEAIVSPWRREHKKKIALLSEEDRRAKIEAEKAEVLRRRAAAEKDRAAAKRLAAEADVLREEAERKRLEVTRLRVHLIATEVIPLAFRMIGEIELHTGVSLGKEDKGKYAAMLLSALIPIVFSPLDLEVGPERASSGKKDEQLFFGMSFGVASPWAVDEKNEEVEILEGVGSVEVDNDGEDKWSNFFKEHKDVVSLEWAGWRSGSWGVELELLDESGEEQWIDVDSDLARQDREKRDDEDGEGQQQRG